jgi:hypothetical protein
VDGSDGGADSRDGFGSEATEHHGAGFGIEKICEEERALPSDGQEKRYRTEKSNGWVSVTKDFRGGKDRRSDFPSRFSLTPRSPRKSNPRPTLCSALLLFHPSSPSFNPQKLYDAISIKGVEHFSLLSGLRAINLQFLNSPINHIMSSLFVHIHHPHGRHRNL